ncbi:VOC family protein [Alsobacter sp. R-9]
MATQIFVNLPVKDLAKSMAFFRELGFAFEPRFTNDKAGCMVVSETIYVMLLEETFFQGFTPKPVCDATKATEAIVCLSRDSREAVDDLVKRAVAAGATAPLEARDYGFMYQHGFVDPEGHIWELVHVAAPEPAALEPMPEAA